MPKRSSPFTDSDVQETLRNTDLIAWYRDLEGRIALATADNLAPGLAPPGVLGGYSTRIALIALEIAAMGSGIDGGAFNRPDALAALDRITRAASDIGGLAIAVTSAGG